MAGDGDVGRSDLDSGTVGDFGVASKSAVAGCDWSDEVLPVEAVGLRRARSDAPYLIAEGFDCGLKDGEKRLEEFFVVLPAADGARVERLADGFVRR